MSLTQEQISVNNLSIRQKHIRLELLDFDGSVVDFMEGVCVDGNLTKSASSELRRSGTIKLSVPINKSATTFLDSVQGFSIKYGGKIWIDRLVRISIGIYNPLTDNIVWHKFGECLIDQPVRDFSADAYTVSFSVLDQMGRLTGLRQGKLPSVTTIFEKGYISSTQSGTVYVKNEMRTALISIITELAGIKKYTIFPIPTKWKYLPYDIKIGIGSTVYDILSRFLEILSGWQMYFDDDGVFTIQPVPSGKYNLTYPISETQLLSDNMSADFHSIKNQMIVYGRLLSSQGYTETANYANGKIILSYGELDTSGWAVGGTVLTFKTPAQTTTAKLRSISAQYIFNGATKTFEARLCDFENSNGYVNGSVLIPNTIYAVRIYQATFDANGQVVFDGVLTFEFLGKQQIASCRVNDNPQSPFYINANLKGENYWGGFSGGVTEETSGNYNITLSVTPTAPQDAFYNGTIVTFMANSVNSANQTVTVNWSDGSVVVANKPLVDNTTTHSALQKGKMGSDYTIYAIRWDSANQRFIFLGKYEYAITEVKSSGEYDNIYSDKLADDRATWELYKASYLQNTITIGTVPNYTLDVNVRIPYSRAYALPQGVEYTDTFSTDYFLINSITYPLGVGNNQQKITATQIYDDYELVGSDYEVAEDALGVARTLGVCPFNCSITQIYTVRNGQNVSLSSGDTVYDGEVVYWYAQATAGYYLGVVGSTTTNGYITIASNSYVITAVASVGTFLVNTNMTGVSYVGNPSATYNQNYSATLTAEQGFVLPSQIVVQIGDTTLHNGTEYSYAGGSLTISGQHITNNVTVTAIGSTSFIVTLSATNCRILATVIRNDNIIQLASGDVIYSGEQISWHARANDGYIILGESDGSVTVSNADVTISVTAVRPTYSVTPIMVGGCTFEGETTATAGTSYTCLIRTTSALIDKNITVTINGKRATLGSQYVTVITTTATSIVIVGASIIGNIAIMAIAS